VVIVRRVGFTWRGATVDKDRIKSKYEQIKGAVKERLGGALKDRSTQAEGFAENKKGKIREGMGELKDELRHERKEPEEP
jgi:uncharacterized protein YjbJ (UPF0337 family)